MWSDSSTVIHTRTGLLHFKILVWLQNSSIHIEPKASEFSNFTFPRNTAVCSSYIMQCDSNSNEDSVWRTSTEPNFGFSLQYSCNFQPAVCLAFAEPTRNTKPRDIKIARLHGCPKCVTKKWDSSICKYFWCDKCCCYVKECDISLFTSSFC